ncbi:DUF1579 domain-containing protein [Pseudoflavitalea sp. G-6-1-2]|uniref:DUF1579 domain-containing protein n=1 Tax=Pseudoflavitalea sp. G-6-1-2 TaxID=2728841 RepID=UPI00146F5504|nr:DUF1579 domain-containing protein [Pseudoflavitalea sp. G-6-1-2]NML19943.1 DUF1579 domain-containing protein [Pseudoflavitalea sp. G-6-1-2]
MKKIALALGVLSFLAVACNNAANEKKTDSASKTDTSSSTPIAASGTETPPPPMDKDAMMKAWEAAKTPGDNHKLLANLNGTWENEMTMWESPDKPPTTSKATSVDKMILGGRYQQATFTGTFMGQPFEGISIFGYDNTKKKFVNTWIDNGGTGIMYLEGDYDPATKSFTMTGTMKEPMSGQDCHHRQVFTITDDKHTTMEMYATMPGQKEMKMFEIKSTKK